MAARTTLGSIGQRTVTALGRTFRVAEVAAAAAALLGLLLALPSIGSPTSRLVLSDSGRGAVLSDQRSWSWGQISATSADEFERVFTDTTGLWFFVAVLVVGLAAVLTWLLRPDPGGGLLGVAGLTAPTTYLAGVVVQRLGSGREQAYDNTGLDVQSVLQPAAVTETSAAVVLMLSLVAMVLLTLRSPDRLAGVSRSGVDGLQPCDEPAGSTESGPTVDSAHTPGPQARAVRPAHDGTTPATGRSSLTGPDTGFRDEPPAAPRRPDHRFEPPT